MSVWSTDSTYIRIRSGFMYLVAILDWFSRYVLPWEPSVTVDGQFCEDTLARALATGRSTIFNTDQGSQVTSAAFTGLLRTAGVQISMDGRGRALDNVFVEGAECPWKQLGGGRHRGCAGSIPSPPPD